MQDSRIGKFRCYGLALLLAWLAGELFKVVSDAFFPEAKLLESLANWALARYPELMPFVPAGGEFNGNGALTVVVFAASLWLAQSDWLKRIDWVLFSAFDSQTFLPIPRRTGLLAWNLYQSKASGDTPLLFTQTRERETAQKRVWDELDAWLHEGLGERHWGWFWRKPTLPLPFSFALLLGPNGMGKTQLACELGRSLAQTERLAGLSSTDWQERLQAWRVVLSACLRRLHLHRQLDEPWDAALWPKDSAIALKRLENWQPRRPTLIIVDEPIDKDWGLIDLLQAHSPQFSHPVRLLFIDQCQPPNKVLEPFPNPNEGNVYGARSLLEEFAFTINNVRPLRPWLDQPVDAPANMPKAIVGTGELVRFLDVVDGNPVLTALGVHWLAKPGHRLSQLTESQAEIEERHLKPNARHRLLDERLQELMKSFQSGGAVSAKLFRAIGCATLVGGLDIKKAREVFDFDQIGPDIANLFPHIQQTGVLPPIKPAMVGDRFLTHLGYGLPNLMVWTEAQVVPALAELVSLAWQLNPAGMQRTLARRSQRWNLQDEDGRSKDLLGQALQTPPEPHNEQQAYDLSSFFAEVTISHDGDLASANSMLAKAQPLISAGQAIRFLAELKTLGDGVDADALPLACVYCASADHALNLNPQDPALLDRILNQLEHILPRVGVRGYPVPGSAEALFDAFSRLLNNAVLQALGEDPAGLARLHRQLAEPLFRIRYFVRPQLAAPLVLRLAEAYPVKPIWPGVWQLMADALQGETERCQAQADVLLAKVGEDIALWVWSYLTYAYGIKLEIKPCRQAVEQLETLCTQERWLADNTAQTIRSRAWGYLAWVYGMQKDAENVIGVIAKIEVVAKLPACQQNPRIQSDYAAVWRRLAYVYSEQGDVKNTVKAVAQVESFFSQECLRYDRLEQWQLSEAYNWLAFVHSQQNNLEQTQEVVQRVEAIAGLPAYMKNRDIQLYRAAVWCALAKVCSELGDTKQTHAIAEQLDRLFGQGYWLHDAELQQRLAQAWRHLVHAHNNTGEANTGATDLAAIRAAVARVEQISGQARWLRVQPLQLERLNAWAVLADVYSKRLDVEKTRWMVDKVESIAANWPNDVELQANCADAWQWLAWAYLKQRNITGLRRVRQQVGRIVRRRTWRENPELQLERIKVWRHLAWAYYFQGYVAKTAWAVRRVELLAGRPGFRLQREIQVERGEAWRALVAVHAKHQDITQTRRALAHLANIVRHWRLDSRLQLELANGYAQLATVYSQTISTVTSAKNVNPAVTRYKNPNSSALIEARRAVQKLEAICTRFANDPEFRSLAEQARSHLGRILADVTCGVVQNGGQGPRS